MVKEYSKTIDNNKQITLKTSYPSVINDLHIAFKLVISKDEKKGLSLIISPDIVLSKSSKEAIDSIQGYYIKKEMLVEEDFIRLLEEVNFPL